MEGYRASCQGCFHTTKVYHPLISYGDEPHTRRVTRVDQTYRYCKPCIDKGVNVKRAVGLVIDWIPVEDYDSGDSYVSTTPTTNDK